MKEPEYRDITLETPVHFSKAIGQNKDMTFIYVSGAGAGSNSWFMWARVKAEAENYFINMKGKDFKDCYVIRPGIMKASSEQNNVSTSMKLLGYCSWMFGNKMEEIGKTMIQLCLSGYEKNILETKDIDICAKKLVD